MASIPELTPQPIHPQADTYPPQIPIEHRPSLALQRPHLSLDSNTDPTPPQHGDDGEPPAAGYTPAMALRLTLLRRIGLSFSELGGARRRNFVLSTTLSLAQIFTFVIMLGLSHKQHCDQPLRTYLILMTLRHFGSLPLSIYTVLVPPRPSRRDPPERAQELEASRRFGSSVMDHRVHRLAEFANLASLVFFILGNYWFISSKTCRASSPELYWGSLSALVISWLYLAELILMVIAVIFFLPILLIAMRFFGWGEAKNEVGPLSKTDIHKLPLRVYLGPPKDDTSAAATSASTSNDPTSSTALPTATSTSSATAPTSGKSSRSFWRLWKSRAKVSKGPGGKNGNGATDRRADYVDPPAGASWIELPDNLASCAICLCDYELPPRVGDSNVAEWLKEDPLRLLPCGHCFHSECSDNWLIVSGRCPVCQRPVKGDGKKKKQKDSPIPPPLGGGGAHGNGDAANNV